MTTAYEVAFTPSFWSSLNAFDDRVRKHIHDAIDKVLEGHPSAHIHKLEGVEFVSFGVNQNAWRHLPPQGWHALALSRRQARPRV